MIPSRMLLGLLEFTFKAYDLLLNKFLHVMQGLGYGIIIWF